MSAAALLGDIGGTHARFALADLKGRDRVSPPRVLATADHPDLGAALAHALADLGAPRLDAVAVCAAGPPRGGTIALTNCPWQVSEAALAAATGVARPLLVNDFTALASALPALAAADLDTLQAGDPGACGARAVIGPGTGLGVSGVVPGPDGEALLTGEGGHVDLAAADSAEDAILARLRERFGHVSAERVLSGPGLTSLHAAMWPDDPPTEPAAVAARAATGDARAHATVVQFCAWLGAVAGDLALTLGARGGVYLAGGVIRAWGPLFDRGAFLRRFAAKGRYREYLEAIPVYIITTPHPAFTGLARLLARRDA